jgi:hypothetical protein
MGVQIVVESTSNPTFYARDDPKRYLKWAWRDIRWEEIFDCIGIDMSAHMYYDDPEYNYRSPQEVVAMRNAIQAFVECDIPYCDEATNQRRDELHNDAVQLLAFFDYYVAHGAHIRLY